MALKFITTSTASKGHGVKMLAYAPAGIGKTMLVPTLPRPFLLSAEAGLLSLTPENITRVHGANTPGIMYDIPGVQIEKFSDLLEAYQYITTSEYAIKNFDSIALDSISEIAEVVLNNARATVKDPRQAYGNMNEQITELIRKFRDLPGKHVYFSAKQDREKDEKGMMLYGPSMPGKQLTQGIDHFFDEVFVLSLGKLDNGTTYRFLRTRPDPQFRAKDRSGALDEFEEPNLSKIINKITGKN